MFLYVITVRRFGPSDLFLCYHLYYHIFCVELLVVCCVFSCESRFWKLETNNKFNSLLKTHNPGNKKTKPECIPKPQNKRCLHACVQTYIKTLENTHFLVMSNGCTEENERKTWTKQTPHREESPRPHPDTPAMQQTPTAPKAHFHTD